MCAAELPITLRWHAILRRRGRGGGRVVARCALHYIDIGTSTDTYPTPLATKTTTVIFTLANTHVILTLILTLFTFPAASHMAFR